ncbi:MAG TPA: FMN-binding protein [Microbacterium sp.]|nr:FMN-binding protein [Microbacterium sp.]
MIRTAAVPRSIRIAGVAAVGVVGAIALAGCAASDTTTEPTTPTTATPESSTAPTPAASASESESTASSGTYADGTYTAEGSYATPESVETIVVTVTLENDIITAVDVTGDPQKRESEEYQGRFIGGIADVVVGQDIDQISVSRVAGSSLTSGGFNQAIDTIKSEAA